MEFVVQLLQTIMQRDTFALNNYREGAGLFIREKTHLQLTDYLYFSNIKEILF